MAKFSASVKTSKNRKPSSACARAGTKIPLCSSQWQCSPLHMSPMSCFSFSGAFLQTGQQCNLSNADDYFKPAEEAVCPCLATPGMSIISASSDDRRNTAKRSVPSVITPPNINLRRKPKSRTAGYSPEASPSGPALPAERRALLTFCRAVSIL